jgi:hypothetical protein
LIDIAFAVGFAGDFIHDIVLEEDVDAEDDLIYVALPRRSLWAIRVCFSRLIVTTLVTAMC